MSARPPSQRVRTLTPKALEFQRAEEEKRKKREANQSRRGTARGGNKNPPSELTVSTLLPLLQQCDHLII